jgi:hypothetical protein
MINLTAAFIILLYCGQLFANTDCTHYSSPKEFVLAKSEIERKIRDLSNKKVIAEQADKLLGKLIAAKSPIIKSWLTKRNLMDKTEEEIATAWREYFVKYFILNKYPQADAGFNKEIENFVDHILSKNFTPKFKKRMEKLFDHSKKAAIQTVQAFKIKQQDQVISRLKKISLYWPKNLKTSKNNAIPLDLIDWGIAYDPTANEINMGIDSLMYSNDETYISVFAHEMGHSIDSCRWGAYLKESWPFEKIGECLRSQKSVEAKKRDDSKLEKMKVEGKLSEELVQSLKENPTCNKLIYPPIGVQADQLPESFADWFSAEVMAHLKIKNDSAFRNDLCADHLLIPGSSYPSNQDRLNKIYFANPKLNPSSKDTAAYCKLSD